VQGDSRAFLFQQQAGMPSYEARERVPDGLRHWLVAGMHMQSTLCVAPFGAVQSSRWPCARWEQCVQLRE
jgi:hypothetical protein